ncbi:CapA family protein, partial [Staphylococcus sp. SIMBA_130]
MIRLATSDESDFIINNFSKRSNEILDSNFIEEEYQKFASNKLDSYLRALSGYGKWKSRIDRKLLNGLLLKKMYNKDKML